LPSGWDARATISTIVDLDLTALDAVARLRPFFDRGVDLLVNNAGFGTHGLFADLPIERQLEEIGLNVSAVVALARAALPAMLGRGSGAIVNVASTRFSPRGVVVKIAAAMMRPKAA
jgi:short-subunit dehydrogenase